MTPEQQAAFVNSQVACALIETASMMARNAINDRNGEALTYDEEAFMGLIDRYGIGHNDVLARLNQ